MEQKQRISDELLAKYLDGQTTPEETESVLSFLAENDENVDDLAHICAAIEVQKNADKMALFNKRTTRRRLLWTLSSAAAVALVVVVTLLVFFPKKEGNMVAVQTDTTKVATPSQISEEVDNQIDNVEEPSSASSDITTPNWQGEKLKNYADATAKTGFCNMIVPSQKSYTISSNRTYFDFSWSTDAVTKVLILKDENGKILFYEKIEDDDYVKFKTADYQKYNRIFWQLEVTYSNGKSETKSGEIQFE